MYKKMFLALGMWSSLWAYDSIDDALENGISSGDITFYGNYTSGVKSTTNPALKNDLSEAGYAVASVVLAYHSAF